MSVRFGMAYDAAFPLRSRVAIVTGATAGIGAATVRELVRLGAFCVINGRRREKLEELIAECGQGNLAAVVGDCAEDAVVSRLFDVARYALGDPSHEACIVIANAGRGLSGSVITSDTSQWEEMVRTNLIACAKLVREAGKRLLAEQEGKTIEQLLDRPRDIIVMGSTVGRHISPFSSMYGSTKFAANSLAEAARRELGPKGIRVSLIEPGFVESEFQGVAGYDPKWFAEVKGRIGPVLQPPDVARLVTHIIAQPAHVHLSDVLIRPTRQEYP
jgi:NADP-dependent 3-hydroxy acid dehydrogenase YdfG